MFIFSEGSVCCKFNDLVFSNSFYLSIILYFILEINVMSHFVYL